MHELGIVMHVAKTLDEVAEENHLTSIGSVTLEVGEVSGIITDYFVDCWNSARTARENTVRSSTAGSARTATVNTHTFCRAMNATSRK